MSRCANGERTTSAPPPLRAAQRTCETVTAGREPSMMRSSSGRSSFPHRAQIGMRRGPHHAVSCSRLAGESTFLVGGVVRSSRGYLGLLLRVRVARELRYFGYVEWGVGRRVVEAVMDRAPALRVSPFVDLPRARDVSAARSSCGGSGPATTTTPRLRASGRSSGTGSPSTSPRRRSRTSSRSAARGRAAATVNHYAKFLKAVFNRAIRHGRSSGTRSLRSSWSARTIPGTAA